jgi:hypothetical protein
VTGSLPPPFVAVTSWVPSVAHVHSPPGLPSASGPASAEQDLLALSDILRPSMAAAAVCTTEALNDARWKAKCPEVGAEQIQRIVHAVVADEGWRTDQGDRTHGRLSDGPHGRHGTAAAGSLRHCRGRASRPNCATRSRTGPRSFRMRAAISTPSPTPCTKSRAGNGRRTWMTRARAPGPTASLSSALAVSAASEPRGRACDQDTARDRAGPYVATLTSSAAFNSH